MSPTTTAPALSEGSAGRFLAQIYAYSFLDELVFIYPPYAVMFADCRLTALVADLQDTPDVLDVLVEHRVVGALPVHPLPQPLRTYRHLR